MSARVFSRFETWVFCETGSVYRAGRLWRDADGEFGHLELGKAIYALPADATNLELGKLRNGKVNVKGVTESGYFEPVICSTKGLNWSEQSLGQDLQRVLGELSEEFDVETVVTKDKGYSKDQASLVGGSYIHLIGPSSHVSAAELHLVSLLDLYGLSMSGEAPKFVECFDLDAHSLLPLVIGVDMANIRHVSSTYKTEVRVPSLVLPFKGQDGEYRKPQVHLSGKIQSLALSAKEALLETVEKSGSSTYYHKLSNVSPGKLLFIQQHYSSEIVRLMIKYRSFIRITDSFVEFQSPCLTLLNTVVKVFSINVLHQIVEVQIALDSGFTFTDEMVRLIASNGNGGPLVAAKSSNHEDQLLLIGNHSNIPGKSATSSGTSAIIYHLSKILNALPPNSLRQLKAVFELHSDYEEFISGKKNGKVTRIMETVPCLIKLEKLEEDDNLFLTLIADGLEAFSNTFAMVINELPAEESFFVPEVYHRPVIGAGGSIIQATMKRYNVFVRFSNSFFLPQNDLSHARYDNVIIRCPFKNVSTISDAKKELNSLAREYGDTQPRTFVKLSPGQYRFMLSSTPHKGAQTIGEIEKNYNVYIIFPFEEPPEKYLLEIRGNADNSLQAAKELIKTCFGIERELNLDKPFEATHQFYSNIVTNFKKTMEIEVTSSNNSVRMTYEQGNPSVTRAMDILVDFLEECGYVIVSKDLVLDFIVPNSSQDTTDSNSDPKRLTSANQASFAVSEHLRASLPTNPGKSRYLGPQVQSQRPLNRQSNISANAPGDVYLTNPSYPMYGQRQFPHY